MSAGAVVLSYNLPTVPRTQTLVLDGATVANIWLGLIYHWRDPAIVSLNPDIQAFLPDANITTVVRFDKSGTTDVFTTALTRFSTQWADEVGVTEAGPVWEAEWPARPKRGWPAAKRGRTVLRGNTNKGVTSFVETTPNSIGYIVLEYALSARLRFATIKNRNGTLVRANLASIQAAIEDFATEPNPVHAIADGAGRHSYPISGYTYIAVPKTGTRDCVAGAAMLRFFRWALESEQVAATAERMGFAVLPPARKVRHPACFARLPNPA